MAPLTRGGNEIEPQDLAERCAAEMYKADNTAIDLGMEVIEIAPGFARLKMPVTDTMVNGHKIGHGGYVFMLADAAFAYACNTYNQRSVAHQCSITFLQAVQLGDDLTAEAVEVHKAGRSGIYDISVRRQTGDVVAEFRGHSRTIAGTWIELPSDRQND